MESISLENKCLLTLDEAAIYTGLGKQKLRDLSNGETCGFVLWNGTKRMFKREKLKLYLESLFSI
ncbi:transposase [Lachnospiraceae bacterium]|nr:transposase [Lachnospiraceae bacterium]